jgi:oligosaccharyltransferase complex subunit gamma
MFVVRLVFLFLLCALMAFCADAKKGNKAPRGEKSSDSAAQRVATIASKAPFTFLSDKNFSTFVANRPRDYHAVIMFTALDPKYQCMVCTRARDAFVEAAGFYGEQFDFAGQSIDSRVAFFIADVDSARSTFNDMGLETVPRVFALPPLNEDAPKVKVGDYEVNSQSLIDGPSAFLDEISKGTGVRIVATQNPWQYILIMGILAYVLAYIASSASFDPTNAIYWYRSPRIWVLVSTICFCVGVSGSIFCVIRSAPMVGRYQGQGMTIFAGQGRDQYLLEGLIVALLTVGCGVAGVLMVGASKIRSPEPVTRHIGVMLGMAVFVVCAIEIAGLYQMKTGWYQFKDTFPPELWTWLSGSIKRSSGLLKRLLRLSEVYLNEFQTYTGFKKKAKSILFDYVQRAVFGTSSV